MNDKISDAKQILEKFGFVDSMLNQVSALTLLALCDIRPSDQWSSAKREVKSLAQGIMEFAKIHYGKNYATGTRESFRKQAIAPLLNSRIIEKNPDDPTRAKNSSNTHYALTDIALEAIKNFGTEDWNTAAQIARDKGVGLKNEMSLPFYAKRVKIGNFKSIQNLDIELGRINVFIGANGCGKTNILEAVALLGADLCNDLNFEGLYSRGVRLARPDLMISSFLLENPDKKINISLDVKGEPDEIYSCSLVPANSKDIYTEWVNVSKNDGLRERVTYHFESLRNTHSSLNFNDLMTKVEELLRNDLLNPEKKPNQSLSEFLIFDLNTKSLRGIIAGDSKKTPLGLNGEGLDLLIATFNRQEKKELDKCMSLFDWLAEVITDKDEKLKLEGLKPGRSISTLYFRDKYMSQKNNMFSAENSNEGILHVLFYIALFISSKTPNFFAIDNIETALNPRLCEALIKELVTISKKRDKQVLITTHNPAILDGLNLFDDEQRLFEVYRDSNGKTNVRRIKFKKDLSDKPFKLSEMWLKGVLGAVPLNF